MADLHVSYKIETIVEGTVKPGDELKGKMFIRNEEKKAVKLKWAGIWVADHIKDYATGGNHIVDKHNPLKKIELYQGGKLESGETLELDFNIKLPNFTSDHGNDWYICLLFLQKTGMIPTQGKTPDEAECILPVPGIKRMPSIGKL